MPAGLRQPPGHPRPPAPPPAAERAFPGVPVEAVRRRAAGVQRRRRAGLAAAVVLAVPAVVLPAWQAPQPPPVLAPSPTPSASASGATALVPTPARPALPSFPSEPSFLPAKVGVLTVTSGLGMVGLESHGHPQKPIIHAGATPYRWDGEAAQTSTVQVQGADATLRTGADDTGLAVGLTWQRDGRWLTVQSFGGLLTADEARQVAGGLLPGSVAATPRLRHTLAPAGYEVSSPSLDRMCLSRDPRLTPDDPVGVCVHLDADVAEVGFITSSLLVGGRPAKMIRNDQGRVTDLLVRLDERRTLTVTQPEPDLDEADLVRFAESVTVAEPAGQ